MKAAKKKTTRKTAGDVIARQTLNDLKNATLVVSLCVNAFVMITWLVAKSNSDFSDQLAKLLQ